MAGDKKIGMITPILPSRTLRLRGVKGLDFVLPLSVRGRNVSGSLRSPGGFQQKASTFKPVKTREKDGIGEQFVEEDPQ